MANQIRRQQLLSITALQQQLIACCCREEPPPSDEADLEIVKRFVPRQSGLASFPAGYIILVTNHGPATARSVEVVDELPEQVTVDELKAIIIDEVPGNFQDLDFDNSPVVPSLDAVNHRVSVEFGNLENGQIAVLVVSTNFDEDDNDLTVVNTAAVHSATFDPGPKPNTVTIVDRPND